MLSGAHLDVQLRVLVEVVEELLVVVELSVPLARLRVSKVIAERNEKDRRTKETRLLTVLIQQEESSERTQINSITGFTSEDSFRFYKQRGCWKLGQHRQEENNFKKN